MTQTQSLQLKGLAILLVVILHLLSAFPSWIYFQFPINILASLLDQLGRISVPLFVFLSGWGLASKYQQSFSTSEFIKRRLLKLLPHYILWSLITRYLVALIPTWHSSAMNYDIFSMLVLGKADYHLYFVPMIFQLYVLFILIRHHTTNYQPWLIGTFIVQIVLYLVIYPFNLLPVISASDQSQYIWFFTWGFYFLLGMQLATKSLRPLRIRSWVAVCLGGLLLATCSAVVNTQLTQQIINFHRFTRLSVFIYASSFLVLISQLNQNSLNSIFQKPLLSRALSYLGIWSYIIFLSHTLFLRLFQTAILQQITPIQFFTVSIILLAGLFASKIINRQL